MARLHDSIIEDQLGKMLKERRLARGMQGKELASILGVSKSAITAWEQGYAYPDRFSRWQEWATALDLKFSICLIFPCP